MPKKSEALGEKAVATCKASLVTQAKASVVSVVDRSKQLVQKSKEIPFVKDTSPQGGVTFSNQIFGNFALISRVLKGLIADYLGDSMSWDRAKFVQAYPDVNNSRLKAKALWSALSCHTRAVYGARCPIGR